MDWNILSHVTSILAVLGVLGILLGNLWLWKKIRSNAFLFYSIAWLYAFGVRLYIMLTDLWPSIFHFDNELPILNALMGTAYLLLFIGTMIKIRAIILVFKNELKDLLGNHVKEHK